MANKDLIFRAALRMGNARSKVVILACVLFVMMMMTSNVAVGKTLVLECKVDGEVTYSDQHAVKNKPLEPTTVRVQIDEFAKALFIEVDGPPAYALSLSSATKDDKTKTVKASIADVSTYMLWTIHKAESISYEERITINRITGTVIVDQTFVGPDLTQRTTYNGTCNKMKNAGARF